MKLNKVKCVNKVCLLRNCEYSGVSLYRQNNIVSFKMMDKASASPPGRPEILAICHQKERSGTN